MPITCVEFAVRSGGKTIHNWPSNFFIEPDGTHVEGEFQAMKEVLYGNPFRAHRIRRAKPYVAKKLGRAVGMSDAQRKEWDKKKAREVMYELVGNKFFDHDKLATLLLATKYGLIIEENWWHDQTWGSCICPEHKGDPGKNWLGTILMQVRDDLRKGRK